MQISVIHTVASVDRRFGGPSITVPSLCGQLRRHGVDVKIVTQRAWGWNQPADSDGVPVVFARALHSERLRLTFSVNFGRVLSDAIRSSHVHLVHDHGLWLPSNYIAAVAAHRNNIPLILSPRGTLLDWAFRFRAFRKKIAYFLYQRSALSRAALFHATSPAEADAIRSRGFQQPIAIIPNGVDVPEFAMTPSDRPGNQFKVALFLSRLHPIKGVDILLKAWQAVRPAGWRLRIAGDGPEGYRRKMMDLSRELGISQDIDFVGRIVGSEKEFAFREASLFVLPTHSENFGVAIAEALAHAVPVITTKGAPWKDLVTYQCGWWIDQDLDALCKAIREACSLPAADLAEMGRRGRSMVIAKYSWERVATDLIDVYRWLVGIGPRPATVV